MTYHMPLDEEGIRARVRDSLVDFSFSCLAIRTKTGAVEPFRFNRVQLFLHREIETQLRETGKVRALVLKGRQLGCSTYVGARFYHRAAHSEGQKVFILTHSDQATQNLFEIVDRFHQHLPWIIRPETGNANAKELLFKALDSGYRVGTAGTKDVGRSATIQMLHGSEVAFWPNAETRAAGIFQAVPQLSGSEIILESTANGFGNFFHAMWSDAQAGSGDYKSSCRGSGTRNMPAPCRRASHSRPKTRTTGEHTGSALSRWHGGDGNRRNSRATSCSGRNFQRRLRKPSSFRVTTVSFRLRWC